MARPIYFQYLIKKEFIFQKVNSNFVDTSNNQILRIGLYLIEKGLHFFIQIHKSLKLKIAIIVSI